uniref:Uncharacterized protein n=1 Tax=Anguilla anguilla TaxID=7936 RepID=A0A0E9US40_ANGAN
MLKGLGSMETRCRNAPRIGNLQQTFRVLILHKSGGFSSSFNLDSGIACSFGKINI